MLLFKSLAVSVEIFALTSASALAASMPKSVKAEVKARMENLLNDPYSAHYTFDIWFGPTKTNTYVACGTYNAKNQFGAYTGKQLWQAYVKGGRVVDLAIAEFPEMVRMLELSCKPSTYGN